MEIRDGAWTLFDYDPQTGRSTWVTHQDNQMVFRIDQPLENIFSANNEDESASNGKRFGDWNRVASIPHHLTYQNGVAKAVEQQDNAFLSRFLNDPDNRKFRTSRGRV